MRRAPSAALYHSSSSTSPTLKPSCSLTRLQSQGIQKPQLVVDPFTAARHEHPLVELTLPNAFTCMGCKEYGAGKRFSCQYCNFELHDFCALAPSYVDSHPLHPQHRLLLSVSKPSGGILRSKCDVCGKSTKGYAYYCSINSCNFHIHPSCAKLSTRMNFPALHDPSHHLILLPSGLSASGTSPCGECKQVKRSGRLYSCMDPSCNFVVHAACAKNSVNGLRAYGFKGLMGYEKPGNYRVLGAAAKIASHMVIGLIGGFIDGIGEGVGEAITDSIVNRERGLVASTAAGADSGAGAFSSRW